MTTDRATTLASSVIDRQEETIKKERNKLFGFIKSKVNNLEDAEDLLQDVLFQFIDGYGTIESIENATSWLFKVARNKIIDLYRYRKVRYNHKPAIEDSDDDSPIMLKDILPADLGESPEEVYFRELVWEGVTQGLDELPEEQRQAFVLHEFEGKSFKEMATMLEEPVNTLISRKRYAVIELRKKLQELYNEIGS